MARRRGGPARRPGAVSRVLLAWELGGGLGHIRRMAPVAHGLKRDGHEVWVAVRHLSSAATEFTDGGVHLLQVPVPMTPVVRSTALSHADILQWGGWSDPGVLGAMVDAWREMIALVDPGVIVLDYAPTGLLAARSLGLPRAALGNGFGIPPRTHPLAPLQPWLPANAEAQAEAEEPVLSSVNAVLAGFGAAPLDVLADVFAADEQFLCTVPELDHFPGRSAARYWGPVANGGGGGVAPDWPDGDPDQRIFLYASASHPRFADLAAALRALDVPVLAYVRDAREAVIEAFAGPTFRFAGSPVDIFRAAGECRIAVCHGGHGTASAMILAGKPLVILPQQMEQVLLGYRLQRRGAVRVIDPRKGAADLAAAVRDVLENPAYAESAGRIAAAHPPGREGSAGAICARVEELLALS